MNPRLHQVTLNYLRRWPCWLAVIAYVATSVFAVAYVWFPNRSFFQTLNVSPHVGQPAPMVNLTVHKPLDEVSRDTRSIYWNAEQLAPIRAETSQPFPKLTSLHVVGTFRPDATLEFLRAMPNLEEMAFLADLPENGLQAISELHKLRHLRLIDDRNLDLERHRLPASLETFEIISLTNQSRLLGQLRSVPNLTTLVLQGPIPELLKESEWERLGELPKLRRLYLRGSPSKPDLGRAELLRIQRVLPHIKVRPAEVSDRLINLWNCIAFMGVLVWALLIVQLQSQFAHSGSRVIPNYVSAHLQVATALWTLTSLFHVVLLWQAGCGIIVAAAAAVAIPGLFWGLVVSQLYSSRRQYQTGPVHPFLAIAFCLQVLPIFSGVAHFFLSDVAWFLDGQQPVLAAAILAAGLAAPALVIRRLTQLHSTYQEFGVGVPPLGLSPQAWTKWTKQATAAKSRPRRTLVSGDLDAQLDAVLAAPEPRSITRLWIAGNSTSGRQLSLGIVVIWGIVMLGMIVLQQSLSGTFRIQVSAMSLMGFIWTDMFTVGLILFWRKGPLLGQDLLRPVSRRQFVRNLFRAVARDLQPLLICHLVVLACLPWVLHIRQLPPLFILTALCYLAFRALAFYATFLFVLTIRRAWLTIAVLMVAWWIVSMASLSLAMVGAFNGNDGWASRYAMAAYLSGSLVAFLCLVWLERYWQKVELA